MLDEMRIPGLSGDFITRAHINPDAYGDGFEGRDSLSDEANPVIENELTVQELLAGRILGAASCWHRKRLFSTQPNFALFIDFQNLHQNLVPF